MQKFKTTSNLSLSYILLLFSNLLVSVICKNK